VETPPAEGAAPSEGGSAEARAEDVVPGEPEAALDDPFVPTLVPETSGGALSFLPTPFDDPLVLGVVALLAGLIAALVVLRRRAARSAGQEALASPFSGPFAAADAFAAPERSERAAREAEAWPSSAASTPSQPDAAMGPLFAGSAASEPELEKDEPSIFDVAEETVRAEVPTPATPSFAAAEPREGAASHAGLGIGAREGDVMRIIEELERRLVHLETRLEEVVDAKERLERHVAAQTEELRVQRAAIARTQRVLRTVVKPDDLATEPIPKP
jgi:hypothetical protein